VSHTRRGLLAAALTAAVAVSGEPASTDAPPAGRGELERYLRLAARHGAGRPTSSVALARSALPAALTAQLADQAASLGVSGDDFLAYALLEAQPLPRDLLLHYLPRAVAFVAPRLPGQPGLLGAALLPTTEPLSWQSGDGFGGLAAGLRPGRHIGVNPGLAIATCCGPDAPWLGPGIPPALAAQYCLQTTRSLEAGRTVLESLPSPRPCLHLLYDIVSGEARALPQGGLSAYEASSPILVASSLGAGGEANVALLSGHLDANLGWLSTDKAMDILGSALPGSVCLVLDLDNRQGQLVTGNERQPLAL